MGTLLIYLVIAVLAAGAFVLLSRLIRPSDERVAEFGPAIAASMRATPAPDQRGEWLLEDRERGLLTSFTLLASEVSIEVRPLGDDTDPDLETTPHAFWERDPTQESAAFELVLQHPSAAWLVELLGPTIDGLRASPIVSVSALLPWVEASVHAPGNGADAARAVARAYPQVRDMFDRVTAAAADPSINAAQ